MSNDPRIDAYIAGSAEFAQPILLHLRAIVHAACPDATETIRWSMPSFSYRERPLAQMSAFKRHCAFGVWDGGAMTPGEGTVMGRLGQIESIDDLPPAERIAAAIRHAATMIADGTKPKRARGAPKPEADVPPALAEALAGDAAAAASFAAFPPGCRREYCEWIAEAKREETRTKRIGEAITMLREGKRRNWKYENC